MNKRYYAYVGPGIRQVTTDYELIKNLIAVYPYSKFRKVFSEEKAWEFIMRHSPKAMQKLPEKYGSIFNKHYVSVDYIIRREALYVNIFTKQFGYVTLHSDAEYISIENRADLLKVKFSDLQLNSDLVSHHAIAIYNILHLLGPYVDVELRVPDHSIFYMLTKYTGSKVKILKVLDLIKSRKGEVAFTIDMERTWTSEKVFCQRKEKADDEEDSQEDIDDNATE